MLAPARPSRRLLLGTIALGTLALATDEARPQAVLTIRPTADATDTVPDASAGPAPDDTAAGLRGTDPFGLPPVVTTSEPAAAAVEPVEPQGPAEPTPPSRLVAGQGSSLLQPRVGAPGLPALVPYPTSRPKGATLDAIEQSTSAPIMAPSFDATTASPPVVGPTVAALPGPPLLRRRPIEDAPFAPVGYTIGALRLTPYFEQSVGYDSNPDQTSSGIRPSAFSRSEGGFSLLSQWSANELKAQMHGGYDVFFSDHDADRPDAAGTVDYRYEATRDVTLDAEGRFAVDTQRPGSPELNVAVQGRPLVTSYGATLGGSDTLGRLTLGLHGLFDRTDYEDGRLSDGTSLALGVQDFNDYGLALRADYEIMPTLKPFAEVTLDSRVHDSRLDLAGYARDSDGIVGRVGTTFELTPLITGTVSAGYGDRSYTDHRLRDLRGPVVDASIVYAITPLTTLTLLANTSFGETNLAGSSGTEARSVTLQVSHALLRNLTLTASVGYLNTDYDGSPIVENTVSATLKASYALSRDLVLEASYNHQSLHSTDPTSSFDQDIFLLGLRLQH